MRRELSQAFADELTNIDKRLASERARLAALTDREEAAVCRMEVSSLAELYNATQAAMNSLLTAEGRAMEIPEKFRKWRGVVAECRRLKDTAESLKKPMEVAENAVIAAQQQVDKALTVLDEHRSRPLKKGDFPTEVEIAAWDTRLAELEAALKKTMATRQEKQRALANANASYGAAAQAFDRAQFSERMTRLPDAVLANGFGERAAVR